MCRAAQAAHRAGVVHRDLKPANVMLLKRDDGEADLVKVLDFGLAKVVYEKNQILDAGLTRPEMAMGTPRYMAPEQFSAGAEAGVPADIYALATMTYEMLTGRIPFVATDVASLYSEKLTLTPRPIDQLCADLSAEFAQVVMSALAPKADQRPQSVDALIKVVSEEIARLRRNPKPVVAPTVVIRRPNRPRRRRIGMIAAVLGIAGAVAAWALRPVKPPVRPAVSAPQQVSQAASAPAESRGGKAIETPVPSRTPESASIPSGVPARPVQNSPSDPKAQVASAPAKVRPKEPAAVSPAGRNTAASHVVAAQGHYYMGDYSSTEREARAAIGLGAGADGYVLLGKALAGLKRTREARQALQQALRLDPLSPAVAEALRELGPEP
jgi:serine/threonine-protein kinase